MKINIHLNLNIIIGIPRSIDIGISTRSTMSIMQNLTSRTVSVHTSIKISIEQIMNIDISIESG